MIIKSPTNLLYANTALRNATSSRLARTRKVRARVLSDIHKIGIFDVSARAGLLFDLLEIINRRQKMFSFYPVETTVPMGLGTIGESLLERLRPNYTNEKIRQLKENILVEDFLPFLKLAREAVKVDIIAGLFAPMLAFPKDDGSKDRYNWNFFSFGKNCEVAISVYGLREYAKMAGRPFEAAVAILTLTEVWSVLYNIECHTEARGCVFDFCENRDDVIEVIRRAEISPEALMGIPKAAQESVERCLDAIREYSR